MLFTTSFSGTSGADRVLTNTPGIFLAATTATDSITFSDTTFTGNTFLHVGNSASGNYYDPNTNVDNPGAGAPQNGGSWTSVFNYAGTGTFSLESISVGAVRFSSAGLFSSPGGGVRDINFTVEYSLNGGGAWTSIGTTNWDSTASDNGNNVVPLSFTPGAPVAVNLATNQLSLRFTAENTGASLGAYIGMNTVAINGVVPEPSTALLGAIRMLALLRRRRA